MAKRPDRDTVLIESIQGGDFSIVVDRATQYEIVTDLTAPSQARFELGDDGTWSAIRDAIAIGTRFQITVNDNPRMVGRLLTRNMAATPEAGATVQLVVRTLLADAMFTAVDPKIGVANTTVEALIIAAYAKLGFTKDDLVIEPGLDREVLTGRGKSGTEKPPDLSALTEEDARPQPPESVFAFVDRHLSRFGFMQWDTRDGRIHVGRPDDRQSPIYVLTCRRGVNARSNNLLSATKTEDFEQVPRRLWVYGASGGKNLATAKVKTSLADATLDAVDPGLDRYAVIIDSSVKTQAQAEARARREMMQRSLQKNSWELTTDGFSYWTGNYPLPYAIDTVADVQVDVSGGASGPYLIWRVSMRGDAQSGHTTSLSAVAKGIWTL